MQIFFSKNLLIEILGIIVLALLVVLLVMYIHHRRIIRKKNAGLARHILAEKELAQKIEHDEVEKKMMERVLQARFEMMVLIKGEKEKARKRLDDEMIR